MSSGTVGEGTFRMACYKVFSWSIEMGWAYRRSCGQYVVWERIV